jgi:tetratricopeptide (TPR) repeat protein
VGRVFISTSSSDVEFAQRLASDLRSDGHTVWFYGDSAHTGPWDVVVEAAMRSAEITLVLLSPASSESANVRDEIIRAREAKQEIVPILVKPMASLEIPIPIQRHVRVDFTTEYGAGLTQLRTMLRRLDQHRSASEARNQRGPEAQAERIAVELETARRQLSARRFAGQPPYDPGGIFRDRVDVVARIVDILGTGKSRLVTVIGRAGIGKTAVACRALAELSVSAGNLSGIVYLSTRTRGISVDVLVDECCAVIPPARAGDLRNAWARPNVSLREKTLRLLEFLRDGEYLILLDNLEDLLDATGKLTRPDLEEFLTISLETSGKVRYLGTSRIPMSLAESRGVRVDIRDGLPPEEAVAVLRDLDPEGVLEGEDPATLLAVVTRLHGVPHALELVIGRLMQDPFATLSDVVDVHASRHTVLQELVEHMYRDLDPGARRVMQALAVFGRPVPLIAVEFVLHELAPGLNVPAVLRWLAAAHFVTVNRHGKTVLLHPLDRDFIYDDIPADGPVSRPSLHRRCAAFYASQQAPIGGLKGDVLLNTDPYVWQFEHLIAAGAHDQAALALRRFGVWLTWFGSPGRVRQLLDALDGKLADRAALLAYQVCRCASSTVVGDKQEAATAGREAVRLAQELHDRNEEAYAHRRLALVHRYTGDTPRAIALFERALALNEAIGASQHRAMLLFEISLAHGYAGDAEKALDHAARSLEDARRTDNKMVIAYAHSGTALGRYMRGEWAAALKAGEDMLQVRDHAPGEVAGYTLQVMALVREVADGNREAAVRLLGEAHSVALKVGHNRLEAYCAHNLAVFAFLQGRVDEAASWAKRAAHLFEALELTGASRALQDAIEARRRGELREEVMALVACARHSTASPDFYPWRKLVGLAADIAQREGWVDLAAQYRLLLEPRASAAAV